jgi:uncharacterized protein YciI
MRRAFTGFAAVALLIAAAAVAQVSAPGSSANMPPMDRYQFGLLKKGRTWTAERSARTDSIQAGHLANIHRMFEQGLLLGAGPLADPTGELRGVFVFRADSLPRIRAAAQQDPAIRSGRLELDLYPWFTLARMGEPYRVRHARGARDSMLTRQLVLVRSNPAFERASSPENTAIQTRHVANVFHLLETGEAAAAGPFLRTDGDWAGVFVFRGDSASARRAIESDPAVAAKHLVYRQLPWYVAYGVFPGDTL